MSNLPEAPTAPIAGPVPLWAPYYGAPVGEAITRFFKKYADFTGRASRSEYWWWALVSFVVGLIIEVIGLVSGAFNVSLQPDGTSTPGPGLAIFIILAVIWGLGTVVPHLALTWRRLHDANFAGPFFFLGFVPIVGGLIVFVLTLLPSKPEGARFDRPKA
jgi:uncharacterized membrane protein YhaH (DUF805 family)